jgi:hypothetical protein
MRKYTGEIAVGMTFLWDDKDGTSEYVEVTEVELRREGAYVRSRGKGGNLWISERRFRKAVTVPSVIYHNPEEEADERDKEWDANALQPRSYT